MPEFHVEDMFGTSYSVHGSLEESLRVAKKTADNLKKPVYVDSKVIIPLTWVIELSSLPRLAEYNVLAQNAANEDGCPRVLDWGYGFIQVSPEG